MAGLLNFHTVITTPETFETMLDMHECNTNMYDRFTNSTSYIMWRGHVQENWLVIAGESATQFGLSKHKDGH